MVRQVERFGKDEKIWEEVAFDSFKKSILESSITSSKCRERPSSSHSNLERPQDGLADYERDRLNRIQENRKQLLDLVINYFCILLNRDLYQI